MSLEAVVEAEADVLEPAAGVAAPWLRSERIRRHSSSECVVTIPPSPVVICLFG